MMPDAESDVAPIWNGFTRAALDAAYNNTSAVAHSAETLARLTERSKAMRAHASASAQLDVAYGPLPRQRYDLFPCGQANAPLFVFIHGGYWQRNHKDMFSCLAEGPHAHGLDVALIGYTLAPEASLMQIIAECEAAIRALKRVHGGRLVVGGWSAGGHLAARLLDMPEVDAAVAISGIFDLEPIRHSYLQEKLHLTPEEARDESPLHRLGNQAKPLAIVVGGDELPELRRQSSDYAAVRRARGLPTSHAELPGFDHFSILELFGSADPMMTRSFYD
ncbi:MAG: alpha/beta hydrolase [Bosea sp. (in: a-proteobacteria)]